MKYCPFCKGKAQVKIGCFYIQCSKCGATGPLEQEGPIGWEAWEKRKDAIDSWDSRAYPDIDSVDFFEIVATQSSLAFLLLLLERNCDLSTHFDGDVSSYIADLKSKINEQVSRLGRCTVPYDVFEKAVADYGKRHPLPDVPEPTDEQKKRHLEWMEESGYELIAKQKR